MPIGQWIGHVEKQLGEGIAGCVVITLTGGTIVQNNQESRPKYCDTCLSVCSYCSLICLIRTACFAPLCSFVHLLTLGKVNHSAFLPSNFRLPHLLPIFPLKLPSLLPFQNCRFLDYFQKKLLIFFLFRGKFYYFIFFEFWVWNIFLSFFSFYLELFSSLLFRREYTSFHEVKSVRRSVGPFVSTMSFLAVFEDENKLNDIINEDTCFYVSFPPF